MTDVKDAGGKRPVSGKKRAGRSKSGAYGRTGKRAAAVRKQAGGGGKQASGRNNK